jgi:hypothetical protein
MNMVDFSLCIQRGSAPAGKELEFYLVDCRLKRFPVLEPGSRRATNHPNATDFSAQFRGSGRNGWLQSSF